MSGVRVFFLSGWTAAWDSTWLYARALQQHVEALGGRFIPNELVTDNEPIEQLTQPPPLPNTCLNSACPPLSYSYIAHLAAIVGQPDDKVLDAAAFVLNYRLPRPHLLLAFRRVTRARRLSLSHRASEDSLPCATWPRCLPTRAWVAYLPSPAGSRSILRCLAGRCPCRCSRCLLLLLEASNLTRAAVDRPIHSRPRRSHSLLQQNCAAHQQR